MLNNLSKYKIILASGSPRRHELLKGLDVNFEILVRENISEAYPEDMPFIQIPVFLAEKKSEAYLDLLTDNQMVITADTIVALDERVLEKPENKHEAKEMITDMVCRKHTVISGVCIRTKDHMESFYAKSTVWFNNLSEEEIDYYVENYKPLDKAGAYGIQEWIGYVAIERIEGSFFNVMGLPTQKLYEELKKF